MTSTTASRSSSLPITSEEAWRGLSWVVSRVCMRVRAHGFAPRPVYARLRIALERREAHHDDVAETSLAVGRFDRDAYVQGNLRRLARLQELQELQASGSVTSPLAGGFIPGASPLARDKPTLGATMAYKSAVCVIL